MPKNRTLMLLTLLAALAGPLFFAFLGTFSRLMGDDYGYFSTILHLGFRDSFSHFWNTWHTSYTFIVAFDALAPLGPENFPPVMPSFVIALFTLGQAWLAWHVLRAFQLSHNRARIAVCIGAVATFSSIIAFHTWENIFWFIATLRHTFPIAAFLCCLALTYSLTLWAKTPLHAVCTAAAFAALCFVIAGLSELQSLLQVFALLFLLVLSIVGMQRQQRRALWSSPMGLFACGLLGSGISFVVQLSGPGATRRVAETAALEYTNRIVDLPTLLLSTLDTSYATLGNPGGILGFLTMLVLGLAVARALRPHSTARSSAPEYEIPAIALVACLAVQLALLPMVWGRAPLSTAPAADMQWLTVLVRSIHIAVIAALCLALAARQKLQSILKRRADAAVIAATGATLLALLFCSGAQIYAFEQHAAYLWVSTLMLFILCGRILLPKDDAWAARIFQAMLVLTLCLLSFVLVPVAVGLYGLGYIFDRSLAAASLAQVWIGLLWGAYIGFLVQAQLCQEPAAERLESRVRAVSLLWVAAILTIFVFIPMGRLIPDFATYAREWDERHEYILSQRALGERTIRVVPYSYDFTAFVSTRGLPMGKISAYYYDVESIVLDEA